MLAFYPSSSEVNSFTIGVLGRIKVRGSNPFLSTLLLQFEPYEMNKRNREITEHSPWYITIIAVAMPDESLPLRRGK